MLSDLRRCWVLMAVTVVLAAACADDGERDPEPQAKRLASSPSHSCALRKAGLYCWGSNFMGELGNELKEDSEQAVAATVAGEDVIEVAAATGRTCIRRSTGEVACWGANERGQTGNGTRIDSVTPTAAAGIDDARQIALDDGSTCVLRGEQGHVACFGRSFADAPDDGALTPEMIPGIVGAVELRAGANASYCARGAEGWVKCWTWNEHEWNAPVDVPMLAGARAIGMTGNDEVCAIVPSGLILCYNLTLDLVAPLNSSNDSVELVTSGALAACAKNKQDAWHCWNVLPTMLHTVGSPAIDIPSDMPMHELVLAGFRACGLRADQSVVCANANDIGFMPDLSDFNAVVGLPE